MCYMCTRSGTSFHPPSPPPTEAMDQLRADIGALTQSMTQLSNQVTNRLDQIEAILGTSEEAARPRPEAGPESPHPRRNLQQDSYLEDEFGRDPDPFVDTHPRRPNLEDREERAIRSIKLDAPTFDESLDPRVYEDWELAMEQYFDWYSMSDRTKFKFAKLRLVHQARLFWNSIENYIEQKGQLPITAWGKKKDKLRRKYLPASNT